MYLGICEGQGACATGLELRRTASARDKELRVNVLSETMCVAEVTLEDNET